MCTADSCETDGVPVTSDCCENNGTPGCDDPTCQDIVCAGDAFCCNSSWDGICASEAADTCGGLCSASDAGCLNQDISAACEDGLFCTSDSCDPDKGCQTSETCPDSIDGCVVYEDSCSEETKSCIPELDDSLCDDGNDCSADICIGAGKNLIPNGTVGCTHEQLPLCGDTCRSAGYFGSHAGDADGENNVTGTIADACGCALVCGEVLSNTELNDADSYVEALCVSPQGNPALQLARQLAALSLNCCASGFGNDCALDPVLGPLFAECNNTCVNGDPQAVEACRFRADCYNNGGITTETPADSDCCVSNGTTGCSDPTCEDIVCADDAFCCDISWDGICAGEAADTCGDLCIAELTCEPRLEDNCHDEPLCNEDLNFCFDPSLRASSSRKCYQALKQVAGTKKAPIHCTVLPPDEDNCDAGLTGEGECCTDVHCVDDKDGDICTADLCEDSVCESVDVCSDCCEYNTDPEPMPGCDDPTCQDIVCGVDLFCCDNDWDGTCAGEAQDLCGDLCPAPVDPCAEMVVCGGGCTTPKGLPGLCLESGAPCETTDATSGACLTGGDCVCQPLIIIDPCAEMAVCSGGCTTPTGQLGQCVPGGATNLVANGESPSDCVCQPGIILDDCATRDFCGGPCTPIFGGPGECVSNQPQNLSAGTTVDPDCTCQGVMISFCLNTGPNGECGDPAGEICGLGQSCQPGLDGECACLEGGTTLSTDIVVE